MKKMVAMFIVLCILIGMLPSQIYANDDANREYIYVAADGNDSNQGSIDSPFASVIAARDKIRELKKAGVSPANGFVVYLREGDHQLTQSLILDEEDSGTETAPIVYRAYPGEKVTILGGASLPAEKFKKVHDQTILDRVIDKNAANELVSANLKEMGFSDFGEMFWPGAYSYFMKWLEKPSAASPELFFNGKVLTVARYPNNGYMTIKEVVDPGANPRNWEDDKKTDLGYVQEQDRDPKDTFEIVPSDDRFLKWAKVPKDEALLYGFWRWDWADHTVPLRKVDTKAGTIESGEPSWYSVIEGARFYAFNLIEEIDMPGEYYLDRTNGILYLYPPEPLEGSDIKLSILPDHLIHINGANHVYFKDFKITAARRSAVYIEKGTGNKIMNCDIAYTSEYAVQIKGKECFNNGVIGCYIHDVNGGVWMDAGDIITLTPGENYAENNHIERFARINKTYTGAITLSGVGNSAIYNEINDAVHLAVQFSGNNHKINYNNIHNVVSDNDDMGAIYTGRSWIARGTEIKYNYIHDLESATKGTVGVFAVYLDDRYCETYMVGNVVKNVKGTAFYIHGGRDNLILNNMVINTDKRWTLITLSASNPHSNLSNHLPGLQTVPYQNDVWKAAYPKLFNILEDDPALPKGNVVRNNLAVNTPGETVDATFASLMDAGNNYSTLEDPGFEDARKGNYLLKEKSVVFQKIPEFKQLPITRMGRYSDRAVNRVKQAIALAVSSPMALVNGEKTFIDQENRNVIPKIVDDSTYVPVRFIAEALGAQVEFDETTQKISIMGEDVMLSLSIGDKAAVKNGVNIELSQTAIIEEGRTLLPLREISNLFGKSVFWDDMGLIVISGSADLFHTSADQNVIRYLFESISAS